MKTCISQSAAHRIANHVLAWHICQSTQGKCVDALSVDLWIDEDKALDLLNQFDSLQDVFDELGIEIYDDGTVFSATDDRPYRYTEQDLSGPCVSTFTTLTDYAFVAYMLAWVVFIIAGVLVLVKV